MYFYLWNIYLYIESVEVDIWIRSRWCLFNIDLVLLFDELLLIILSNGFLFILSRYGFNVINAFIVVVWMESYLRKIVILLWQSINQVHNVFSILCVRFLLQLCRRFYGFQTHVIIVSPAMYTFLAFVISFLTIIVSRWTLRFIFSIQSENLFTIFLRSLATIAFLIGLIFLKLLLRIAICLRLLVLILSWCLL